MAAPYRFVERDDGKSSDVPLSIDGPETPLFCEIYFGNEYITRGETSLKLKDAVQSAYTRLMDKLLMKPLDSTACSSVWHPRVVNDPDVWKVMLKTPLEEPDYFLTTNQAKIKETMKCSPDLLVPVKDLVLMEFQGTATSDDEAFDMLTLCTTQQCMLLECELSHVVDETFKCWISVQGKLVAAKSGASQSEARKICAMVAVSKLAQSHDVISVSANIKGPVYTRNHLLEAAKKAKKFGMQPLKCCSKTSDSRVKARDLDLFADEEEEEIEAHIPWIGKALADLIFKHITEVTLEDVRIAISDMPKSMKDVVTMVNTKMGLHNAGTESQSQHAIWRRAVTPVEVSKIVNINFGETGRYIMRNCLKLWPPFVLESFKKNIVERYTQLYEDLLKEEHCDQITHPAS